MSDLAKRLAGRFLVIDGPDGAGKSTQVRRVRDSLMRLGVDMEVVVDPGTTAVGLEIRHLLLDRKNSDMCPMCEMLLFMASRAQLVDERIRPALERGASVLSDRFTSATVAYQGASGIEPTAVIEMSRIATRDLWPDLTIILDLPVAAGFDRLGIDRSRLKRPSEEEMQTITGKEKRSPRETAAQMFLFGDRLEHRSSLYHERVRTGFRNLPSVYPGPVSFVDAVGTEEEVFARILQAIEAGFSSPK